VAGTVGSSPRRWMGMMGNSCWMAQLSTAERKTAGRGAAREGAGSRQRGAGGKRVGKQWVGRAHADHPPKPTTAPAHPPAPLNPPTAHVDVVHLGARHGVGAQRVRQGQVRLAGHLADALAGGVKHHVHLQGGGWGRGRAAVKQQWGARGKGAQPARHSRAGPEQTCSSSAAVPTCARSSRESTPSLKARTACSGGHGAGQETSGASVDASSVWVKQLEGWWTLLL
jgi:hypothetical protein